MLPRNLHLLAKFNKYVQYLLLKSNVIQPISSLDTELEPIEERSCQRDSLLLSRLLVEPETDAAGWYKNKQEFLHSCPQQHDI